MLLPPSMRQSLVFLRVDVVCARHLPKMDIATIVDPDAWIDAYVKIRFNGYKCSTPVVKTKHPDWMLTFFIPILVPSIGGVKERGSAPPRSRKLGEGVRSFLAWPSVAPCTFTASFTAPSAAPFVCTARVALHSPIHSAFTAPFPVPLTAPSTFTISSTAALTAPWHRPMAPPLYRPIHSPWARQRRHSTHRPPKVCPPWPPPPLTRRRRAGRGAR